MICKPVEFDAPSGRKYRVFPPLKNPFCADGHLFTGYATWRIEYYHSETLGWRNIMHYDAREKAARQFISWADWS